MIKRAPLVGVAALAVAGTGTGIASAQGSDTPSPTPATAAPRSSAFWEARGRVERGTADSSRR